MSRVCPGQQQRQQQKKLVISSRHQLAFLFSVVEDNKAAQTRSGRILAAGYLVTLGLLVYFNQHNPLLSSALSLWLRSETLERKIMQFNAKCFSADISCVGGKYVTIFMLDWETCFFNFHQSSRGNSKNLRNFRLENILKNDDYFLCWRQGKW